MNRLLHSGVILLCLTVVACEPSPSGRLDAATADLDSSLADSALQDMPLGLDTPTDMRAVDAPGFSTDTSTGDPDAGNDAGIPADSGVSTGPQNRTVSLGGTSFEYALYVPSSYVGAATPLLVLFHGQGGTGANMRDFWQSTAENAGVLLMATSSTGSGGGWSPRSDYPRLEAALNDTLETFEVDPRRVYVWGFSAGAHITHDLALQNTDLFAAYAVSAGTLQFTGSDSARLAARRIPVHIHIGTEDPLHPGAVMDRATFIAAGWVEGNDFEFIEFSGGHTIRPEHLTSIWGFLESRRLP